MPSVAGVQGFAAEGSVADRGERDEAGPSSRLEEPEAEDIKTITTGETMYQSAARFEDLPISDPLLQVLSHLR